MVTVKPIRSSLFSNLYESFLHDDDPFSDEQDWRNVFDYPWETEEGHCGHAMLEDGKVVGMMGMVFSDRNINGTTKKFCNLHTWWVREDHRGRSLTLLRPVLKLEDYTITHFTPCDTIRALTKKLGFKPLSTQLRILLPFGVSGRKLRSEESALIYDEPEIEDTLTDYDRKILTDHRPFGCGNLMVRDGNECCYLLYTRVVRHWMPYCHIHYISNKDIFAKKERVIRSSLLRRHKARYVAVDERLVQGMKFPLSFRSWKPPHALYKSSDIEPSQIDNLYSDVVFLNLTVHLDASQELQRIGRRFWPLSKK